MEILKIVKFFKNNSDIPQGSAMDKTGEVVLHRFKSSILVWYKPRNGRKYSYQSDAVITGNHSNFGSNFAAFDDKRIIATSGEGKVFVYERSGSEFLKTQEISINGVFLEFISHVVDDDGTFVVMGKQNGKMTSFVYQFQ
jgi:hypothetical protein